MENMSDTKNDTVQQGDRNSLAMSDINDDIIDVSAIDFSDHDTWLQPPSQEVAEDRIGDLGSWLRNNVEQDCNNLHDNRRSIDTRTFTRPKKRLGRLSFESIVESTVAQSPNVWNQVSPCARQEDKDKAESIRHDGDSMPHMLRPSIAGVSGLCSTTGGVLTTGPESLEAFLDMSRSKGIDSFIDLAEPEFNDDIMDVSQPSVLYSSVMSVNTDDLSQTMNQSLTLNHSQISKNSGIEDSQILTESMMQTSMFGDVLDVNFNDTFAKNSLNVTVLENENYSTSLDTTFLATTSIKTKDTINGTFNNVTFNGIDVQSMNATYTPSRFNATLTNDPHASYIVNRSSCLTSDIKQCTVNDASYVVRSDDFIEKTNLPVSKDIAKDASFVVTSATSDIPENTTFRLNSSNVGVQNDTFNVQNFDATFEMTPLSSIKKSFDKPASEVLSVNDEHAINETLESPTSEKIDAKIDQLTLELTSQSQSLENLVSTIHKTAPKMQSKLNAPRSLLRYPDKSCEQNDTFDVENFDATFEETPLSSHKKSFDKPASEVLSVNQEHAINETHESPTSEKIDAKIDQLTIEPTSQSQSLENLVSTIHKTAPKMQSKLNAPRSLLRYPDKSCEQNDTFDVQNFDATFEKTPVSSAVKTLIKPAVELSSNEHGINETFDGPISPKVSAKIVEPSVDTVSLGGSLDNLDVKFHKPAVPKVHSKMNPPRPLSRLPQSFQKSNPNFGSSGLKYGSKTAARSTITSFGFNRPPAGRPVTARNVESHQVTSKIAALGGMKSGSEQRLDVTRNVAEHQRTGSGGSTESIDSTQSAHSAPDFDDRLSVRSDGSNTSYSVRTMNIEEFQKIVRMREECLKQESTPKPGRRVLENNWVATSEDLPSPILKNGPETYGSRGSSPRSTDSTVKTSSPLLSPTESLQNLPIDEIESKKDKVEENKHAIPRNKSVVPKKITQASAKPPRNTGEQRMGLRPPASWTSGNKPASGIPRPASRIPGPRLARPYTKINQGDTKK